MNPTMIPFAEGEAKLDWIALTEALAAGHTLPKAEIGDTFLYRGEDTLLSRSAWIDGMGIAVKTANIFAGNPGRGAEPLDDLLRDEPRRLTQRAGQLEGDRDREVTQFTVWWILDGDRGQRGVVQPVSVAKHSLDLRLECVVKWENHPWPRVAPHLTRFDRTGRSRPGDLSSSMR